MGSGGAVYSAWAKCCSTSAMALARNASRMAIAPEVHVADPQHRIRRQSPPRPSGATTMYAASTTAAMAALTAYTAATAPGWRTTNRPAATSRKHAVPVFDDGAHLGVVHDQVDQQDRREPGPIEDNTPGKRRAFDGGFPRQPWIRDVKEQRVIRPGQHRVGDADEDPEPQESEEEHAARPEEPAAPGAAAGVAIEDAPAEEQPQQQAERRAPNTSAAARCVEQTGKSRPAPRRR